jgi:hypothetical protein
MEVIVSDFRQRRLRQVQLLRRLAKVTHLSHHDEVTRQPQIKIHNS